MIAPCQQSYQGSTGIAYPDDFSAASRVIINSRFFKLLMDSLLTFRVCQSILKKMLFTEKDYFKTSLKSEYEQYRVSLQRKLEREDV